MANGSSKFFLFLLRISMGWIFLYSGATKLLDPKWSAEGFLKSAKTFPQFYNWLAGSQNIDWINLLNEWGQLLIGLALIFGFLTRFASVGGVLMMILYYFPGLTFPYVGAHSYLVDEHIIYALIFGFFASTLAGQYWGIDGFLWNLFLPKPKKDLPPSQSPIRGITRK